MQNIVRQVNNESLKSLSSSELEMIIIRFQAHIRGYLLRQSVSNKFTYYHDNIDKVKKIQIWWRAILARRYSENYLNAENEYAAVQEMSTFKFFRKHVSFR